jgi:hypothetical protein
MSPEGFLLVVVKRGGGMTYWPSVPFGLNAIATPFMQ